MTQDQLMILVGVCLLVAIVVGVVLFMRQRQTQKLRERFGRDEATVIT